MTPCRGPGQALPPHITVVDLETTGHDPNEDRPIEIGWCRLWATGTDRCGEPAHWGDVGPAIHAQLVDPGRPIPPESSAVHHLIDDDVRGAQPWGAMLDLFERRLDGAVALAAHNAKFERQWLTPLVTGDRPWICTWKCALRAWPDAPGHASQVLRYWLAPRGLSRDLATPAHRAGPDAYVAAHLLRALLQQESLATLLKWSEEPALLPRVPFGRTPPDGWRGCPWSEVDDAFLMWILRRDFDEDVRFAARIEHERRRREWEEPEERDSDPP